MLQVEGESGKVLILRDWMSGEISPKTGFDPPCFGLTAYHHSGIQANIPKKQNKLSF
jgi:hypothetical protein